MGRSFTSGQNIVITAAVFDSRGKLIPTRITWQGRSLYLSAPQHDGLLSFCEGDKYFWLGRINNKWRVVRPV